MEKPVSESLFNKAVGLQVCNFIKKRLEHRCFPMIIPKFLGTPILKNICKQLILFIQMICRLVFSRFMELRGNLGIVKEKPTGKTFFSREKKRLAPRIYQTRFCLAAFLRS